MSRLDALRRRAEDAARSASERAAGQSPAAALRAVQRTLDEELGRLPRTDRGPVDCRAGCSMCCHLRVMATAPEVFALLDYLERTAGPNDFDAFTERVRSTDERLRGLPAEQLLTVNLPCPALVEQRCSAYAGRPLNCRAYHSLSVDACRDSFEHPDDLHRGHPQLAPLARVHAGIQAGLVATLSAGGLDARQYELVSALAEAIDDPAARDRMAAGHRVFMRALTLDHD